MTREEAKTILDDYEYILFEDEDTYNREAFRMAIKALSQEPCTDAVSRDAVLNIVSLHTLTIDESVEAVKRLPSVTQRSGEWIKVKSGDKDFPESIVCSRCSNENSHLDFNENAEPIGKVFVTSKFCPNCGAKMESEG